MKETKKPIEILVLEPDPIHIEDANEKWNEIRDKGIPLRVSMIQNGFDLDQSFRRGTYDGMISAVKYPGSEYSSLKLAQKNDTPIVFTSNRPWFDDESYEIHHSNVPLVEGCFQVSLPDGRVCRDYSKNWDAAYHTLLVEMAIKDLGGYEEPRKNIGEGLTTYEFVKSRIANFTRQYNLDDSVADWDCYNRLRGLGKKTKVSTIELL